MRLDRSKFIAWLRAKQPDAVVGVNRDCHTCPIANFYNDVSGGWEIVIFDRWGDYYVDRGHSARRAPSWAEQFFFAVDGEANPNITASRAIELLDRS